MINEYWFNTLNPSGKTLYKNMLNSFSRMRFEVNCGNINPQEILKIYNAVLEDHPELFYLSYKQEMVQSSGFFGVSITLKASSIYSGMQITNYRSGMNNALNKIKADTDKLSTEAEKEKAIVDYFIDNVDYKIDIVYNQNAGECLAKNKAQCSGIARAFKYVCDNLGIWCIVVGGQATDTVSNSTGPHAWNIVRIDGKYYHLDVTSLLNLKSFPVRPKKYPYFNYTDTEIKASHYWSEKTPPCTERFASDNGTQNSANFSSYGVPEGSETNAGGKVCSSLYEVRVGLLDVLNKKRTEFSFNSKINSENDNELMKVLNLAVSSTIKTSTNKVRGASISIRGGFVTISIQYK